MVKSVCMKNYSCSWWGGGGGGGGFSFKSYIPGNISIIDVNMNEGEIEFLGF